MAIKNGMGDTHEILVHDISLDTRITEVAENSDLVFICVPTLPSRDLRYAIRVLLRVYWGNCPSEQEL